MSRLPRAISVYFGDLCTASTLHPPGLCDRRPHPQRYLARSALPRGSTAAGALLLHPRVQFLRRLPCASCVTA
eukprot:6187438-Pleurochrysis_carterae.AAC.3